MTTGLKVRFLFEEEAVWTATSKLCSYLSISIPKCDIDSYGALINYYISVGNLLPQQCSSVKLN